MYDFEADYDTEDKMDAAHTCIAECTPFLSCFAFARKFVAGGFPHSATVFS